MKKTQSKKNHASSARDVSQDLDDFMHVKDPRTVSAKKKHVARLPWSSQRSKNSRNFPGEKKKHHKEMIAVKRHQRMLSRGVDLEKINKFIMPCAFLLGFINNELYRADLKLGQIVLDEVDMFCFQPVH
uniref:Uncharacterized protein n=1 Tax=Populus trichocarpa TaxID=3694 RepID=A0A3N7F534_POPTR